MTRATNLTYLVDISGIYRMTRHIENQWPEHRADRLVTEAEHGETLMGCLNDEFVGSVVETARHLWGETQP